jgi:hypothetical protein
MTRYAMFFPTLFFFVTLLGPQVTMSQKADPTIVDFKVQALYRAAKLTWKTGEGLKDQMSVQILRAETFEEGPYNEVDGVNLIPGKNAYEYIDKTMGVESKYYYKLVIKETGEFFGPISTRPYFSPPATQWQPSEQQGPLLALREEEDR